MNPPLLTATRAAALTLEARSAGLASAVALVLGGASEGRRRLLRSSHARGHGETGATEAPGGIGNLGDPLLERSVDALLDALIEERGRPGTGTSWAGTREAEGAEGAVPVYFEVTPPRGELLIVGAGHLALPLHRLGRLLGFGVTVVDDRPAFARADRFPEADRVIRVDFGDPFREVPRERRTHVVLVTRGHRFDFECLRRLLLESSPPEYVGMIGSRRRVRATFHQLVEEGVSRRALAKVRAPLGLDLGAETPEEIAVAVAAEWIELSRGGTGRPLMEVERILDRFFDAGDAKEGEGSP